MNDKTKGGDVADAINATLKIEKSTEYRYSNIIVSVFATVVLGVLVDGEQVSDRSFTDKLIVRMDSLGYIHAMHQISEWEDFRQMADELIKEEKPWSEASAVLAHMVLYYFDGAEGLLAKRDAVRKQITDEARTGINRSEAVERLLKRVDALISKVETSETPETPPTVN